MDVVYVKTQPYKYAYKVRLDVLTKGGPGGVPKSITLVVVSDSPMDELEVIEEARDTVIQQSINNEEGSSAEVVEVTEVTITELSVRNDA